MSNKTKPNGYWNIDRCAEEALKFKTRSEFRDRACGAYYSACRNNWIDSICIHMIRLGNKQLRCIYSYEFLEDKTVYVGLTYNLNMRQNSRNCDEKDPVTKHMLKTGFNPIRKQLTDYISLNDAIILESKYLEAYKNNEWKILNIAKTGGIGGNIIYWTKERCIEAAKQCKNTHEFNKLYKGAYSASLNNGWINEINNFLEKSKGGPVIKHTYESCKLIASLCITKKEFRIMHTYEYQASTRNKWISNFFGDNIK